MEVRPLLLRVIEDARAEARALPPQWAASESDLGRFSRDKSLYGYQRQALDNLPSSAYRSALAAVADLSVDRTF